MVCSDSEVKASFRVVHPLLPWVLWPSRGREGGEGILFMHLLVVCVCGYVVPVESIGQCRVLSIFHKCSPPYVVCLVCLFCFVLFFNTGFL